MVTIFSREFIVMTDSSNKKGNQSAQSVNQKHPPTTHTANTTIHLKAVTNFALKSCRINRVYENNFSLSMRHCSDNGVQKL